MKYLNNSEDCYPAELAQLIEGGALAHVGVCGNNRAGWVISWNQNNLPAVLLSTTSKEIRVFKTSLSLFKTLKKFGCPATFTEWEISMLNAAAKLTALYANAQLHLEEDYDKQLTDNLITLYIETTQKHLEPSNNLDHHYFIQSVKECIVDPALFVGSLNAQILRLSPDERLRIKSISKELSELGNIRKDYQSQLDSILKSLNG